MYQEPHERRYLAMLGVAVFVLLCMVSSANLLMLFLFWQILSYLLYILIHNHAHAGTLASAFRTFTILRVGDVAFLAGIVLAYSSVRHAGISRSVRRRDAIRLRRSRSWPGVEVNGATAVTLLLLVGA